MGFKYNCHQTWIARKSPRSKWWVSLADIWRPVHLWRYSMRYFSGYMQSNFALISNTSWKPWFNRGFTDLLCIWGPKWDCCNAGVYLFGGLDSWGSKVRARKLGNSCSYWGLSEKMLLPNFMVWNLTTSLSFDWLDWLGTKQLAQTNIIKYGYLIQIPHHGISCFVFQ